MNMKKLLLILCFGLISACGPKKMVVDNTQLTYAEMMEKSYDMMFSHAQFDSICVADNLDNNLENWHALYFKNFETGQNEAEYSFIKSIDSIQVIYRVEPSTTSDSVRVTKRITY